MFPHNEGRTAILSAVLTIAVAATPARAQGAVADPRLPSQTELVSLSGPRFGLTVLPPALVDSLKNHDIKVGTIITQFGWQWEKQFLAPGNGIEALSELVVLVGGLEQGVFLPSATWLVGVRSTSGFELGVGPNVSPAGAALALAAGTTMRVGALNVPFNVAAVPSAIGARISFLTGFTLR